MQGQEEPLNMAGCGPNQNITPQPQKKTRAKNSFVFFVSSFLNHTRLCLGLTLASVSGTTPGGLGGSYRDKTKVGSMQRKCPSTALLL